MEGWMDEDGWMNGRAYPLQVEEQDVTSNKAKS